MSRLVFALGVIAFATAGGRADTTVRSGPAKVSLVELYTSEGCSSCPPVEKWLGGLRDDPGLWRRFVPVAFHVNYWDNLGWRDALATKAFTQREYAYAEAWGAPSVYTPCVVRDGAESRAAVPDATSRAAGELSVTGQPDGTFHVEFTPAGKAGGEFDVAVAWLGGGIVSAVRAGENSGRELHHEFVALALETARLMRADDGRYRATLHLAVPPDRSLPPAPRRAVAAWVTPRGKLAVIQAAGGWLTAP